MWTELITVTYEGLCAIDKQLASIVACLEMVAGRVGEKGDKE